MKLLSLGNIEKKLYLYTLIYIIIHIIIKLLYLFYFPTKKKDSINLSLDKIIEFGSLLFYAFPEFIMRRSGYNKRNLFGKDDETHRINRIFIFNNPKNIKFKGFTFLIIFLIIYLLYYYFTTIYSRINKDESFIFENELSQSLKIVFLFLLSKFIDKSHFYKHQYLSMIIIVLMGIIRFIIEVEEYNYKFNFPDSLLSLILGLISHFFDSAFFFVIKKYMDNNYYSPFFMSFLIGTLYSILSLLSLLIFAYIDCGETEICRILSEKTFISDNLTTFILILCSIIYAIYFLINAATIYNFSVFHLMLLISIGKLILRIIIFTDTLILEQILFLLTFIIDIFAVLVFVEIIILNFCGFNYNIKNNIISRAGNDIAYILDSDDNHDDDISIEGGYSIKNLKDIKNNDNLNINKEIN